MNQLIRPIKSYVLILFLICAGLPVSAQNKYGRIAGRVTDQQGLPLSGVTLDLISGNKVAVSDENGQFIFKLPEGDYGLSAKALGYQRNSISVHVAAGQTSAALIQLTAKEEMMQEVVISGLKMQSSTATRTLTPVQDIPQSITVIGQKTIKQQAAFDLSTISRNVTGVNFNGNYAGAGSAQFFSARGFELNNAQNYRWNGMMIWNWGDNYSDNIEQVEFLKGPASILFGEVAPGGIMNFVTKKPEPDFRAELSLKTGSWGLIRPSADLTGAVTVNKKLRYRLNTSYEQRNSFREQVSSKRWSIAPTLAWDISQKLSLQTELVFKRSSATDDAGLVSPDGSVAGLRNLDPRLYLGDANRRYEFQDQSYFTVLNYQLSSSWQIKATAYLGHSTNRPFGLWFDRPEENGDFSRRAYGFYQKSINTTLSAEASGTAFTGSIKHRVLLGFDYQSSRQRHTNGGELHLLDTSNIYQPVSRSTFTEEPNQSLFQPYSSLVGRKGLHFQDQLSLPDGRIQLLLGFRLGQTTQGNDYKEQDLAGTSYEGYADDLISKRIFTPRAGLVFKPGPHATYYFSYSRGYEINSPDLFAQNYLEYATPPATTSTQVELGIKRSLAEGKLGISLSLFQLTKRNPYGFVYLDPENPNYDEYKVYYEGKHRSRGIELEADGQLSSRISLLAGIAYTRTSVVSDPGYSAGNWLPNAPRFTANVWLNYEPVGKLKGFSLGTGLFYKSKSYANLTNDPNLLIPKAYTWDASVGYRYRRAGIQLNAMNISNQISYLNPWQFNLFDVKPLRQFIVTLNYRLGKN